MGAVGKWTRQKCYFADDRSNLLCSRVPRCDVNRPRSAIYDDEHLTGARQRQPRNAGGGSSSSAGAGVWSLYVRVVHPLAFTRCVAYLTRPATPPRNVRPRRRGRMERLQPKRLVGKTSSSEGSKASACLARFSYVCREAV